MNDAALLKHIKSSDLIFRTVLGKCDKERVDRSVVAGRRSFVYRAQCEIKPKPENDCQFYRVEASGTIDTPTWATVRDIHLKLQCTA